MIAAPETHNHAVWDATVSVKTTPPGHIVIPFHDSLRYPQLTVSLSNLRLPAGSKVDYRSGVEIAFNLNHAVRHLLEGAGQWLLVMGDDHAFEADFFDRLWAHNVDVVVPHCLQRRAPYWPVLYSETPEGMVPRLFDGQNGLVTVDAAGSAGMLVRRHVLEAITPPWFALGQQFPDLHGEDRYLCQRIREAGFVIHADLDTPLAHFARFAIRPKQTADGRWTMDLREMEV